ncbi:MAG: YkgJ family cysteine cluster protein [Methanomicrobia archaeon]|nr:YkgJ family cysteine cluster protein [Methanomicrobia archaeon]
MKEENLKKQILQFRELVGDELFRFTMSQNVMAMEKDRRRFKQLALEILEYFECERCCKCCREMPVHLNDEDLERLSRLDGDALFDKMDDAEVDNYLKTPCPYLKGTECSIYENKPTSCCMFPFVVIRPVPTLQLCPMGKKIFADFKELARKYDKKDLKVQWEEGASDNRLPDYSGSTGKKAVYVALPIAVLEKFLKYLRIK